MLNFNAVQQRITTVCHPHFDTTRDALEFALIEQLKADPEFKIHFQMQSHHCLLTELDWLNRQVAYAQFVHWATVTNKMNNNEVDFALLDSIQKWFKVSFLYKQDRNVEDCALCKMFLYKDHESTCSDCPVKLKTDYRGCIGTPYALFKLITKDSYGLVTNHDQLKLALAMLQFLMNLYYESKVCSELHDYQKWQQDLQDKIVKAFEVPPAPFQGN